MYYMNKTKRNLIIAAAIINLITVIASLVMSILMIVNSENLAGYEEYYYLLGYSYSIFYVVIQLAAGIVGSILLLYSVREKGRYFRSNQGIFATGFIIVVVFGGSIPWLLLLISLCIPDIVIMNSKSEIRHEEKMQNSAYDEKKKKIENLKKLRDDGLISEEEYKEKLFEIL